MEAKRNWNIFFSSVFFVLGFSVVFSIVGILLQTVLSHATYQVQLWLGRVGGVIIILFGLFLLKLIQPAFLTRNHTIAVKHQFSSYYLTSFIFGAAFAVGWTPCVSAALGAILALASVNAGSAFILLMAYTLGVGIPFLLVGLFTDRAQRMIERAGKWMEYLEYFFGVLLIVIGILIFTSELSKIANIQFLTDALTNINHGTSAGGAITSLTIINAGIAFFAGLVSFFSPCILPIIPGFLSYLASSAITQVKNN
ncbi:MAG TPA: cytochrome c biogenesis protein CcdA [Candidatus Paceibacterota bacterium]|jgi:cytochrome c-type biogenesis protein|nr:cytochrome c biogenesis protein CcdA [Candidatus Paceibacterota bacterium]